MKILFDQNAPRPLARFLPTHTVTRLVELGWAELRNGDLLAAAENAGFELMITADKNIRYQQNLAGRRIALLILPSGRWPLILPQLREVTEAINAATLGSYHEIPLKQG